MPPSPDTAALATLLRERKDEIIREWTRRVLEDPAIPEAKRLSEPALKDDVPGLLDCLACSLAGGRLDQPVGWAIPRVTVKAPCEAIEEHAHQRSRQGYALAAGLRELSHLRGVIVGLWCRERGTLEGDAVRRVVAWLDEITVAGAAEMERSITAALRREADLLDQLHDAVHVSSPGGRIVYWNHGAEETYGWSAAEALGRVSHELLRTTPSDGLTLAQIGEALAREGRWEGELLQTARDGRRLTVETRLGWLTSEDRPCVLQADRDVTFRRAAEQDLRESEARLRAIVDTAVSGILLFDERGTVLMCNRAAERLFKREAREVVGRNVDDLLPDPLAGARSGPRQWVVPRYELTARRGGGTSVPVEVLVSRRAAPGGGAVYTAFLQDVTDRRRAEAEREELLASERAARREAERAMRAKEEFVAVLSHELRTPLTTVQGWTTLLRTGSVKPDALPRALEAIDRNAHALTQMVDDLLDVSRIATGKLRLSPAPMDLRDVVAAAADAHAASAGAKGILLEKDLGDCVPMKGDAGRLQQAVSNLVGNAVKFTPPGGRVGVTLRTSRSTAEIVVSDTGAGIPGLLLPFVFERFRQGGEPSTRRHGGLGLGLALVRHLVGLHGGTVQAYSEGQGRGATFTVRLPIAPLGEAAVAAGEPAPQEAGSPSLKGLKVLVVDDDADAREVVQRILSERDAEVITASSAPEALVTLAATLPDVLVSDIGMPTQDGYQLLRAVRALPPGKGGLTPAVAMTGFTQTGDRQRALSAGYQLHVGKPLDPAGLVEAVACAARCAVATP